jgi:hypothetical protein
MTKDKLVALLTAVSARLAALQGGIVAAGALVPFLPVAWQAKAAAYLALAAGWVAAVVALVSRVTPVPGTLRGLTVAGSVTRAGWHDPEGGQWSYTAPGVTTTSSPNTTLRNTAGGW